MLHRRLGWASVALVATMAPLAVAVDLFAVERGATPPFFTPTEMMAADWVDMATFVGLYAAGVLMRRRTDWHRRLLLTGTVLLTLPAIGRLHVLRGFGLHGIVPAAQILLVALALVGPVHDLVKRRRVHPAYWSAVGALVVAQTLHGVVAASAPMRALAARLVAKG